MSALADLIRDAAVMDGKQMSNRTIAALTGVAAETINRIMRGEGKPDVDTVDKIADALRISRADLRDAADLPRGIDEAYVPPVESRLLDQRQRAALDEVIRSIVAQPIDELSQIEDLLRGLGDEDLHHVADLAVQLSQEREQAAIELVKEYAAKEGVSVADMLRRLEAGETVSEPMRWQLTQDILPSEHSVHTTKGADDEGAPPSQNQLDLAARDEDDPKEDPDE